MFAEVSVFLGGEGEVQALLGGLKWLRSKRLQGVLVRSGVSHRSVVGPLFVPW